MFHHALLYDIRAKFKKNKRLKPKQLLGKQIIGKYVRQFRLQYMLENAVGFSSKRWKYLKGDTSVSNDVEYTRKIKTTGITFQVNTTVQGFFTRDDVSRMTTGKKETITQKKVKMQKRFLTDTLKNLHLKFLAECWQISLSYQTFCRLRPFWVLQPTAADRETCLCKTHENTMFLAKKLHQLKLLTTVNIEQLIDLIVCNNESRQCMYRLCEKCKDAVVPLIA